MSIPDFTKHFTKKDNSVYQTYQNKHSFPKETKRDTRPFSDQLPYHTTSKQFNYQGYRPKIAQLTNTRGNSVCFNSQLAKTPFYLYHWQPFEDMPYIPFNGDVFKDPRYAKATNNFSNEYKNTV